MHFRTFVPLSLPLPTPAALLQTLSSLFRARSAMCSEQTSFLRWELGPESCGTAAGARLPYTRPALGTTASMRDPARVPRRFPERSMRSRLRRSAGCLGTVGMVAGEAPARRGWGPRRLSSPLLEASPLGAWSSQLPSPFKYDSCNPPGIFFLVPREKTAGLLRPDAHRTPSDGY